MFKSLYSNHSHPNRKFDEVVLNGKGAVISFLLLLLNQFVLSNAVSYAISWSNSFLGTNFGIVELNLAVQLISLAVMILFFGRFYFENLKNFFHEFKAEYVWAPIVCYVIAIAGNMAIQILLMIIRGRMESTSNNNLVNDMLVNNPIQMILVTVVLAPIVEETIFRAGLCRSLTVNKNYFIKALGFVLSISLFALMHVYQYAFFAVDANGVVYLTFNANEFLSILTYIPMGVSFSICSYICKNFWGSVACHMLCNGISVTLMLLMSLMTI